MKGENSPFLFIQFCIVKSQILLTDPTHHIQTNDSLSSCRANAFGINVQCFEERNEF